MYEGDLSRPQNDENTRERAEETISDLESQPENAWEPDSSSELGVSNMRSEVEIDDKDEHTSVSLESDIHSAKCFLEKNWGYNYDYDEEQEENEIAYNDDNEPQVHGLLDMVDYWQSLGVPDSIGRASPHAEVGESDGAQLDWSSILSGGDNHPKLDIQISKSSSPISSALGMWIVSFPRLSACPSILGYMYPTIHRLPRVWQVTYMFCIRERPYILSLTSD